MGHHKDPRRNQLKRYHAPGIWEDAAGDIHFNIPEIQKFLGIEDLPVELAVAITGLLLEERGQPWKFRASPED